MHKVISELKVGKYMLLALDKTKPNNYSKYKIDGTEYEPVTVYDAPFGIAIEASEGFVGKTVEFI